jgi:hypothetical protein
MAQRRRAEAGIVRGCCLGLILLAAVVVFGAFCADRAFAAPDLGAAPRGPDDGAGEVPIAVALAAQLAPQLVRGEHGTVLLSEHDLTVLAQAHNPHPERYSNFAVRVRNRQLVISADDHYGPFTLIPVLRVAVRLTSASPAVVGLDVQSLDVGQLPLPGFIRDRLVGQLPSVVAIPSLFDANPVLKAASGNIECVGVVANGLVIGVHRPGSAATASTCATGP